MRPYLTFSVIPVIAAVLLGATAPAFADRVGKLVDDTSPGLKARVGGKGNPSIQARIDAASDGDVILLGRGRFAGPINFRGKRITIRGIGPETVVVGPPDGSVVRFETGEGRGSVLESLTITGGNATDGGGIRVVNSSPTLQRLVVFNNRASGLGAGLYVGGGKALPLVRNNIFAYNDDSNPALTDAHQLFVDSGASGIILNNTIVRGNGNGILIQPGSRPTQVRNNLIAWNGSRLSSGVIIGRGICDFSGSAIVRHNLFFQNSRAAILTGTFVDFELVTDAEGAVNEGRFRDNLDGDPGLRRMPSARTPLRAVTSDFILRAGSPARNAGAEDNRHRDRNRSRNDIGHTGGPLGWNR